MIHMYDRLDHYRQKIQAKNRNLNTKKYYQPADPAGLMEVNYADQLHKREQHSGTHYNGFR